MSSSTVKHVPVASKTTKKPESKTKKEISEKKAMEKKVDKTNEIVTEMSAIMDEMNELQKKFNALMRKCATRVGIKRGGKPISEKAYINNQWKAYCNKEYSEQIAEKTEEIKMSEGKDDNRGTKMKATKIIADEIKSSYPDLYIGICNLSARKYKEEYLTAHAAAAGGATKEDESAGEESADDAGEADDTAAADTKFSATSTKKASSRTKAANAGAGAETYESEKGSGDEKAAKKSAKAPVKSSKKKSAIESITDAITDE